MESIAPLQEKAFNLINKVKSPTMPDGKEAAQPRVIQNSETG
jgi:hypothetical protein